ncbi:Fic family protein [Rhodococcus sp. ARC_M13]|uniref:Fic family protein n=1 Tax=unclassified Rhodococcus (in: high G+C Gram-positive bacteria) TaxID=192944 RepID=UPI001FB55CF8|nr:MULTISPECIES: Fic family protein [unclassified Rhodococcus (in: high G+C Gram-positive bacteria)]MCJ0899146.1 Fic family protein [Rhodococcus sp. ARC_M13]MCJ0948968.1 Fic family protein [Rhodococcus sp. ARC_M8]
MSAITITDLAGAIYSAGTVFDGLAAGRLDTENFLRSGSLAGVSSRSDLSLLEDLRDVAHFIIDHHHQPIDPAYVCAANASLTRSGALHPGQLRTEDQQIGVRTRYGQHTPPAMTEADLEHLIASLTCDDAAEYALDLFVHLAKAQPFEDGNKRTALFVANSLLIGDGRMLVVPVDDNDSQLSDTFNDLLAKAYLRDEHDAVKDLMRRYGLVEIPDHRDASEGP